MTIQRVNPPLSTRSRIRNVNPTVLILHATAGASARSSINYLRTRGNAYHYIIARDSRDSDWTYRHDGSDVVVYHCVQHQHRGTHVSSTIPVPGTNGGGINDYSIAVSLANYQAHVPGDPHAGREEYPAYQLLALNELVGRLKEEVPSLVYLTTHAVVQPWNRADPIGVDAPDLARRWGYTWWQPTAAEIRRYRPR